jgi:hypothetical protein
MGLLAFGDGEGTWELWGELTRRRSEVALVLLLLLELLLVRVLSREVRVELVEVRLVRSGEVDMVGGRSGVVVIGGGCYWWWLLLVVVVVVVVVDVS